MSRRKNLCTTPFHKAHALHHLDPFERPDESLGQKSSSQSTSVKKGANPPSLSTRQLDEPPCCIEFVPTNQNYVVLGTYVLSSSDSDRESAAEQRRQGSLILQKLDPTTGAELLSSIIELDCAVLDLHFQSPHSCIFGASTSDGRVGIFRFNDDQMSLEQLGWIDVSNGSNALVTSMTWMNVIETHTRYDPVLETLELMGFAVTLTDGSVRIYYVKSLDPLVIAEHHGSFQKHSQEAWCIAFSETSGLLLSGGDDAALHVYDVDSLDQAESQTELRPLYADRKSHGAGVIAILSLEQAETSPNCSYILTGSYDEHIRVLRLDRASPRRTVLAEERLGGGVWRLKQIGDVWHKGPSSDFSGQRICTLILASCMYAGVRILQVIRTCGAKCSHTGSYPYSCVWTINVVAKFEEHESMNYASDVRMVNGVLQFMSTSFYDKRVCVWSLENWKSPSS